MLCHLPRGWKIELALFVALSIRSLEQITQRSSSPDGDSCLFPMLAPIMQEMATLTEGLQVACPVVCRIVIQMSSGQDHLGPLKQALIVLVVDPVDHPPPIIPPDVMLGIKPTTIA